MESVEQRLIRVEERLADVAVLATDPPMRLEVPRWERGQPMLMGHGIGKNGLRGMPGPPPAARLPESVTALLEGQATDQQMAAARANEQALLDLARTVRDAEFEVERTTTAFLNYYIAEAVSVSSEFIAPTEWPDGLAAPRDPRGPVGPAGPAGGPGELAEPDRVEPLWSEATTERLRELSARADAAADMAETAARRFSDATGGWDDPRR